MLSLSKKYPRERHEPPQLHTYGLNSTIEFFYQDGFGNKLPMEFEIQLNNNKKTTFIMWIFCYVATPISYVTSDFQHSILGDHFKIKKKQNT